MISGNINQLPAYYIEPTNIHTWLTEIFDSPFGLPCICGDQTVGREFHVVRPRIINVCQRVDDPCKIDIEFHLGTAHGIYHYQPNESGYSLDTTDGKNGTWHQLIPDTSDSNHNFSANAALRGSNSVDASWNYALFDPNNPNHLGSDPCEVNWAYLGIPVHRFTFDMCNHVSSWLSETGASFRLTFNKNDITSREVLSCGVQFIS